jgi:hypothetical protein
MQNLVELRFRKTNKLNKKTTFRSFALRQAPER